METSWDDKTAAETIENYIETNPLRRFVINGESPVPAIDASLLNAALKELRRAVQTWRTTTPSERDIASDIARYRKLLETHIRVDKVNPEGRVTDTIIDARIGDLLPDPVLLDLASQATHSLRPYPEGDPWRGLARLREYLQELDKRFLTYLLADLVDIDAEVYPRVVLHRDSSLAALLEERRNAALAAEAAQSAANARNASQNTADNVQQNTLAEAAKHEAFLTRAWNGALALLLIAGITPAAGVVYQHTDIDTIEWNYLASRLAISIPILLAAAYCGRVAALHRERAFQLKLAAVQINTIDSYCENMTDEHRGTLRLQLGQRIFTDLTLTRDPGETDTTNPTALLDSITKLAQTLQTPR